MFAGNWYSVGGWTLTLVQNGDNAGWAGPVAGINTLEGQTTVADGIYTVSGHSLRKQVSADWHSASFGLIVRTLHNDHLVIADEHSLYLFDGQKVSRIAGGFNLVKDLLVDRWNRLWVATYEGVYCFFGQYFTNHRLTDRDDIVRAIGTG